MSLNTGSKAVARMPTSPRVLACLASSLLLLTLLPVTSDSQATMNLPVRCTHTRNTTFDTVDMETGYHEFFDCWAHYGIHHYFVGRNVTYALWGGSGTVRSTEILRSPPLEPGTPSTAPLAVNIKVPIEISMDGLSWTAISHANYRFLTGGEGQWIGYSFTAAGEQFRYIRFREPYSAAQGLSGFLDYSDSVLQVSVVGPAPEPALVAQTGLVKRCETDILEDVWAQHPCFYGNVDPWDSPSWFHTYPLGNASLDRVHGNATTLQWRPYEQGVKTSTRLLVMTSVDGMAWKEIGNLTIQHGQRLEFDVSGLNGMSAKFVRLATQKTPKFFGPNGDLRHPEGVIYASNLALDGLLPA